MPSQTTRLYNTFLKLWKIFLIHRYYSTVIRKPIRKRRCSDAINIFKIRQRKLYGAYHNLVAEMRLSNPEKFFNYFRMTTSQFDELLLLIGPSLKRLYRTKEPLSPGERLAVTLRYLASGDSMTSMSYAYRVGKSTVSQIILETCNIIWLKLKDESFLMPNENSWKVVAKDFNDIWQLPNCLGAIDGKHFVIQAPPKSGSSFYNYKNSFSFILLAVCDAKYRFTIVDIGASGRQSDGGVLRNSELGRRLEKGELHFPLPTTLEDTGDLIPYYIVGDEAFPLKENLMRPFSGKFLSQEKRIFNYRLSRGRRTIENSFGILVARWRIFRKPLTTSLNTSEAVVKATLCLHNFLMTKNNENGSIYCPVNFVDQDDNQGNNLPGQWRQIVGDSQLLAVRPVGRTASNTYKRNAADIRNKIAMYFMTEGAVPFQWDK